MVLRLPVCGPLKVLTLNYQLTWVTYVPTSNTTNIATNLSSNLDTQGYLRWLWSSQIVHQQVIDFQLRMF